MPSGASIPLQIQVYKGQTLVRTETLTQDVIQIGKTVELECLDTPGHTMSHICVLAHGDRAALFCGDTLFNAGAGNCHNGGHPAELYQTFADQLSRLPDATREWRCDARVVTLARLLDLEHVGAEVREHLCRVAPRQESRQVEYMDAFKWWGRHTRFS